MPITLTFGQWKHRNFWKLLYVYLTSNLAFEDWDMFCQLCYVCEQNKEKHLS